MFRQLNLPVFPSGIQPSGLGIRNNQVLQSGLMYLGGVQKLQGSACFPLSRLAGFRATEVVLIPDTIVLWIIFLSVLHSESSKRDIFLCGLSWNEKTTAFSWNVVAAGHLFHCTRCSALCWPRPRWQGQRVLKQESRHRDYFEDQDQNLKLNLWM